MKRCPSCQQTYPETTTFCLNDGTPLVSAEPGSFDAPPTMRMPPPRVTDQPFQGYPPPQQQPYYPQPAAPGFKLTNKILGISGAVLLLLGTFMPLISVMGFISFSLFTFIQGLPTGPAAMPDASGVLTLLRLGGIVILLLGVGSLVLALKNNLKPLVATGAASLIMLAVIFIKMQSLFSNVPAEFKVAIGMGWGFFAMVAAGIILIVAGVKKEANQSAGTGWTGNPPMNY